MSLDRFKRKMAMYTDHHSPGEVFVNHTRQVSDFNFRNDPNYRRGMLYDWDLKPITEIDFKIDKSKNLFAEGQEVEYYIQFPSGFHPEFQYRDRYFKKDGRERFGFYLDVPNNNTGKIEKWLIVNKDVINDLSRYNAFKCNWCSEWLDKDGHYHAVLSCLREATDATFSNAGKDKVGGTTVDGEISLIMPSNRKTYTILFNQRFLISDNPDNPQAYEVTKIKDTSPLGIMRVYMKQCEYNAHTDYYGEVNKEKYVTFKFPIPLPDLPDGYGNSYHAIADCVKEKQLPRIKRKRHIPYTIHCSSDCIYIGKKPVTIRLANFEDLPRPEIDQDIETLDTEVLIPDILDPDFGVKEPEIDMDPGFFVGPDLLVTWHYLANGEPVEPTEVAGLFGVLEEDHALTIGTDNKELAGNVLSVYLSDEEGNESNVIDLEVRF